MAGRCSHQRSASCLVQGPTETPFEGGTFELAISVPEQYPLVAPAGRLEPGSAAVCPASAARRGIDPWNMGALSAVKYRTKIFHPNVHWKVRTPTWQLLLCWGPAGCLLLVLLNACRSRGQHAAS